MEEYQKHLEKILEGEKKEQSDLNKENDNSKKDDDPVTKVIKNTI